jgi:hypothetical protein
VRLLILLRGRYVEGRWGYRVPVENVYTRLTGGVEFSSLNRPMTNLESVVVLEEKTSVRVKVVLVASAAFGR